ncbi:MAG TPA: RdgB/HAM1 family non-canonical purine NTP pyrophosphatase [Dehalococcoidia bacterium]|nr:RdgB/HAM1 family non-canonical purine NTP pyrophosphatase [Dehalococcoidia bacterium]
MPRLLIATNNAGKLAEYGALLQGCGWELVAPADLGLDLSVEETGPDYATNARIKAEAFARASGLLTLADDSGLEVDALGGRPGPLSARYAGPSQTDEMGVDLLLEQMKDVPPERRQARFRCVIVLAGPGGAVRFAEGECPGVITNEPSGHHGFGYDPIFYLPELGRTMAELTADEKNAISHRSRAAQEACAILKELLREAANRS